MVKDMPDGGVIVDVAIDQGGTTEYTEGRPTSQIIQYSLKKEYYTTQQLIFQEQQHKHQLNALCNATAKYVKLIAKIGC